MQREREGFEPPAGKRPRMTSVPAGGGEAAPPRSQKLLGHTPFVVFFVIMARVTVRNKAAARTSQTGVMENSTSESEPPPPAPQLSLEQQVQRIFHAISEFREVISSKLDTLQSKQEAFQAQAESKLDALQGQVDGLRNEMRQQPAHLRSNRHAGVVTNTRGRHCKLDTLQGKQDAFQAQADLDALQGQVDGLRQEMRQQEAHLRTNRHAGDQHSGLEANQERAAANGSNTDIPYLCFTSDLKPRIYTGENITDENNAPIKLEMRKGGEKIARGPFSKMKVEIVALQGEFSNDGRDDWSEEESDRHIVQGREGQVQMLGSAQLRNGEVELSHIRFTEASRWKPLVIVARVCKNKMAATGMVREALTKPVMVLDRRGKEHEKSHPPRLDDGVYRLEEIAKKGSRHSRLKEKGILTVQDLLKAFNKDPRELRKILGMENQHGAWSKLIKHANDCLLQEKPGLKRYEEGNVVLYFNCVHDLVGAAFPHDYVDAKGFDPRQKALVDNCKGQAYEILEEIQPNYVMTNNIPELVSAGAGAARNCPRDVNTPVTEPILPTPNSGPMIAGHDSDALITQDYQDTQLSPPRPPGQTSLTHGQQQIISPSVGSDWQLDQLEIASMIEMLQYPSGASTSAHPYFEMLPDATLAWAMTAPAQPSSANQEQGPS
ncbi:hypothetical protein ACP70R_023918 [Stipagrostis hirtigluma subsp. patula]